MHFFKLRCKACLFSAIKKIENYHADFEVYEPNLTKTTDFFKQAVGPGPVEVFSLEA